MSGSGDQTGDDVHIGQGRPTVSPSPGLPTKSGGAHTTPLVLDIYCLALPAVRPEAFQVTVNEFHNKHYTKLFSGQSTSGILDLEVAVKEGAVKKFGKFADICQGQILTEAPDVPIDVCHI